MLLTALIRTTSVVRKRDGVASQATLSHEHAFVAVRFAVCATHRAIHPRAEYGARLFVEVTDYGTRLRLLEFQRASMVFVGTLSLADGLVQLAAVVVRPQVRAAQGVSFFGTFFVAVILILRLRFFAAALMEQRQALHLQITWRHFFFAVSIFTEMIYGEDDI